MDLNEDARIERDGEREKQLDLKHEDLGKILEKLESRMRKQRSEARAINKAYKLVTKAPPQDPLRPKRVLDHFFANTELFALIAQAHGSQNADDLRARYMLSTVINRMFTHYIAEMVRSRMAVQVGNVLRFLVEHHAPDPEGWYYASLSMEFDTARIILAAGWSVEDFGESIATLLRLPNLPDPVICTSLSTLAASFRNASKPYDLNEKKSASFAFENFSQPAVRPYALKALAAACTRDSTIFNELRALATETIDLLKHPRHRAEEVDCALFALLVLLQMSYDSQWIVELKVIKRLKRILRSKMDPRTVLDCLMTVPDHPSMTELLVESGAFALALTLPSRRATRDYDHKLMTLTALVAVSVPDALLPQLLMTPHFVKNFSRALANDHVPRSLLTAIVKLLEAGAKIGTLQRYLASPGSPLNEREGLSNPYLDYLYATLYPSIEVHLRLGQWHIAGTLLPHFESVGLT